MQTGKWRARARLGFITLAALLALTAGSALAQDTASGPVPQLPVADFARMPLLSNVVMSPNGNYLAASYDEDQNAGTNAKFQLVVFALPSLKVTARLNFAPWRLPGQIVWVSPTRLVVAEAKESGTFDVPQLTGDIIALNADGSQQRMLYSIRARGTPGASFNMMDMVGGAPSIAGASPKMDGVVYLAVNPFPMNMNENNRMAHRTLLYRVDSVSGYPKKIAEINQGSVQFFVHDDKPVYAITQNALFQTTVYLPDGQGGWRKAAAGTFGKNFEPLWINDHNGLVYALYSADGGPNTLISCKPDGSDKQVLAGNGFGSVNRVFWTPRSDRVPFAVTFSGVYRDGIPHINDLADNRWAQIQQALLKAFPGEMIDFAGMSEHGNTILLHAFSNSDPGEYALFDSQTMHVQPLMQIMPWFKPGQLAARQPVRFRNADGTELDGFISFPVGVPHKDLPMVLIPHGGPIGVRDQWSYIDDAQQLAGFLANRGYAVMQVNYRGSSGRGVNFQLSGFRQFGTGIQQDLIDGVKWAIAKGYADPQRICVFGGSFGGYSALMQPILAPKLYKCSIDYAGIYNYLDEFDRSDTSHLRFGREYFRAAVGDRAQAEAISPSSMVSRFNVPVLIMQGGEDPRVVPQNAEQLRSALEAAHKPYQWLWFPDEGHGFTLTPHRVAMFEKVQAFLAQYIGPGAGAASH